MIDRKTERPTEVEAQANIHRHENETVTWSAAHSTLTQSLRSMSSFVSMGEKGRYTTDTNLLKILTDVQEVARAYGTFDATEKNVLLDLFGKIRDKLDALSLIEKYKNDQIINLITELREFINNA